MTINCNYIHSGSSITKSVEAMSLMVVEAIEGMVVAVTVPHVAPVVARREKRPVLDGGEDDTNGKDTNYGRNSIEDFL